MASFFASGPTALASSYDVCSLSFSTNHRPSSVGPQVNCTYCFIPVSPIYSCTVLCVSGVPVASCLLSVIRYHLSRLSWASLSFTDPFCFRNAQFQHFLFTFHNGQRLVLAVSGFEFRLFSCFPYGLVICFTFRPGLKRFYYLLGSALVVYSRTTRSICFHPVCA